MVDLQVVCSPGFCLCTESEPVSCTSVMYLTCRCVFLHSGKQSQATQTHINSWTAGTHRQDRCAAQRHGSLIRLEPGPKGSTHEARRAVLLHAVQAHGQVGAWTKVRPKLQSFTSGLEAAGCLGRLCMLPACLQSQPGCAFAWAQTPPVLQCAMSGARMSWQGSGNLMLCWV